MKILITGGSGFIGTNLIDFLLKKEHTVVNFDKAKPVKQSHFYFWQEGNIMDEQKLLEVCNDNSFDALIHLAAVTDSLKDDLEFYAENHLGTKHVLNVINKSPSIKRVIITSTQYVYKSHDKPFPSENDEYIPHTVYGKSKVLTEQYTRDAGLACEWVIVRPTNIWGPWHMRYPLELWRLIDKRLYYHPVKHPVIRTYGYVKNVVHQIYGILFASSEVVNHQTFYLGDPSMDSYMWLNEFSMQLTRKKLRRMPKSIFKMLSIAGDIMRSVKIPFPLYSVRFKNMIEDYPAPTERTVELFGQAEKDLSKNVAETVEWLKGNGKTYFEYWKNKH